MFEPEADPGTSIICPIDIDTSILPAVLVETFTEFDVGGDPYLDGSDSTGKSGVGFTNNTEDYFFRTFVL